MNPENCSVASKYMLKYVCLYTQINENKTTEWGWRGDSVVKSTLPSRGPEVLSQCPHQVAHLVIKWLHQVQGSQCFWPLDFWHLHSLIHTHMLTHTYI